jgi:hypothetical protein
MRYKELVARKYTCTYNAAKVRSLLQLCHTMLNRISDENKYQGSQSIK